MADASYPASRVYRRASDGALVVPSGATLLNESGGTIDASAGTLTLAAGQIVAASLGTGAVTAAKLADPTVNNAIAPGFKCARFHFDATVQGANTGTTATAGATLIPISSFVVGGLMRVSTAAVGTGASIALQLEGANDVISVAAISGAPWSSTGTKAIVPLYTAATSILTTAARDLSVVVTAANVTALVFDVYLFYIVTA